MFDAEALRTSVRGLLQNAGASLYSDADLDAALIQGKGRLERDRPNLVSVELSDNGTSWYNLSNLAVDWTPAYSLVKSILYPTPDRNSRDYPATPLDDNSYSVGQQADGYVWLWLNQPLGDKTACVYYTTPWKIKDLDGAIETTLLDRYRQALVYVCTAQACLSLATKSAGNNDKAIRGDLINFSSKESQYRRMAKEWMASYYTEVGLGKEGGPAPAFVVADFNPTQTDGSAYLTHRNY